YLPDASEQPYRAVRGSTLGSIPNWIGAGSRETAAQNRQVAAENASSSRSGVVAATRDFVRNRAWRPGVKFRWMRLSRNRSREENVRTGVAKAYLSHGRRTIDLGCTA